MLTYSKPHKSLPDQLALLKSRGLQVADDKAAIECLHRNGYYRLSAYWYPFRQIVPVIDSTTGLPVLDALGKPQQKRSDSFLAGSTFEDAQNLYVLDKKFKLLLLDAIERVEIATRAEIALYLGAMDSFAHTKPIFFRPDFTNPDHHGRIKYQKWINKFDDAVGRSRDEFVLHYERKYGTRTPLPIWIAIELWDFGMLSHFYEGMNTPYRVDVASRFSIPRHWLMASWLRSLNYVRNVIAHHGRLWNLNLADNPSLPTRGLMVDFDPLASLPSASTRIYSICCILCHFSRVVNPQSTWPQQLAEIIKNFPSMPYASVQDMGFPPDWQTHNFWK